MEAKLHTLRIEKPKGASGPRRYVIRLARDNRLWICVTVNRKGVGVLKTNLLNATNPRRELEVLAWNMQVRSMCLMLLGLACAGLDVDSPEAQQGINAAFDTLVDQGP